jgi:ribonuclease P protein subunit RPR2
MDGATKQIAQQRVHILFEQAKSNYKENPQLAQRYVETARKIAMSARMRLPSTLKSQVCRNCNTLLVPGESSRVRIKPRRETHIVTTCFKCGHKTRIPLEIRKLEKKEIEQNNKQDETSR